MYCCIGFMQDGIIHNTQERIILMNQLRQQLLSSREKQHLSPPLGNKKNCAEISSLTSKGVFQYSVEHFII